MKELQNEKDFEFETKVAEKVVVDFNAIWCGPCKMQHVVLEEVEEKNPGIHILLVDVDKFPGIASQFGITSIPTLFFYKNGKLVKQKIGYTEVSELTNF